MRPHIMHGEGPDGDGLARRMAGRADFSDLPEVAAVTKLVLRMLLVALGSTFFVLVPLQAGMAIGDLSRVLQGLIAGIGFLLAGAILKQEAQRQIHGLMTAAGLWLTAAVGVAVGLGREASAVLGTVLAFIILALLPQVRPHADVDERVRQDTGALQHTAREGDGSKVRARDTQEESPGEW